MASFIGIDFGGTKIAAARFDAKLNLLARTQAATPASTEELVAAVKEAARSVWADDVGGTGVWAWPAWSTCTRGSWPGCPT